MTDDPTPIDKKRVNELERRRMQAANNTAAICNEIGAMPDARVITDIAVEAILQHFFGVMELDEKGRFVGGSVERLAFETERAELTYNWMLGQKDRYLEARKSGLHIPGGADGGLVVPKPGGPKP